MTGTNGGKYIEEERFWKGQGDGMKLSDWSFSPSPGSCLTLSWDTLIRQAK